MIEWFVRNSCGKYGIQKVTMNVNGFFIFKFSSIQDAEPILRDGPWMIREIPIFLHKFSPSISLFKEDLSCVSVRVKFHDVPLVAYTPDGLVRLLLKLVLL